MSRSQRTAGCGEHSQPLAPPIRNVSTPSAVRPDDEERVLFRGRCFATNGICWEGLEDGMGWDGGIEDGDLQERAYPPLVQLHHCAGFTVPVAAVHPPYASSHSGAVSIANHRARRQQHIRPSCLSASADLGFRQPTTAAALNSKSQSGVGRSVRHEAGRHHHHRCRRRPVERPNTKLRGCQRAQRPFAPASHTPGGVGLRRALAGDCTEPSWQAGNEKQK
ncbi:hypothetical protein EDC01DRAFT_746781 [Geopyxis carbonaria]|nr:hypothetical protein EDC01DRAFT_746781 [Geopyxis carbonaria]